LLSHHASEDVSLMLAVARGDTRPLTRPREIRCRSSPQCSLSLTRSAGDVQAYRLRSSDDRLRASGPAPVGRMLAPSGAVPTPRFAVLGPS
jgi:hypothetical protein